MGNSSACVFALPAAVFLLASMPASGAHAQAPCPMDTVECAQRTPTYELIVTRVVTNAALLDSGVTIAPDELAQFFCDLSRGSYRWRIQSSRIGSYVFARLHDRFALEGVAAGTSVPLQVQLLLSSSDVLDRGGRDGHGASWMELAVDGVLLAEQGTQHLIPGHFTIDALFMATEGRPFDLGIGINSDDGFDGSWHTVDARLEFVGLPAGAFITSCQGFHQDAPTASRRVSWGRLKQTYR